MRSLLSLFLVFLAVTNVQANNTITVKGWSDEQIVNAIYKAEGGKKTKYPYGIKSIKCESQEACRQICLNTVRNNRKRYAKDANYGKITFIEFLGSRFAPVKGSSLSAAERKLNPNWVKNVLFFLEKDNKNGKTI